MEDPLKKIYKKAFDSYTQPVDSFEFDKLQLVLQKHNFMRFQAFQFNVYYASMIATFFLLSIGTTSHYVYNFVLNKPQVEVSKTITPTSRNVKELSRKSTNITRNENKQVKAKIESKEDRKKDNSSTIQLNISLSENNETIIKEQASSSAAPENLHVVSQPSAEPTKIHIKKQKVIIELQDTIHKFDTIKTKSSFWQRKK
jgi:uncharacterized membrane protein YgaE (UPF0421/DUF939 family)